MRQTTTITGGSKGQEGAAFCKRFITEGLEWERKFNFLAGHPFSSLLAAR